MSVDIVLILGGGSIEFLGCQQIVIRSSLMFSVLGQRVLDVVDSLLNLLKSFVMDGEDLLVGDIEWVLHRLIVLLGKFNIGS